MPANSSHASIFVSNLRFLNLDKLDDGPSITAHTLTAKDAQQNQKKRIQCVEWALYRLFEVWDLEETKNKLQPFFPPLAPLQSINLRAALFRCLNELKKNGVLGKEVTIRKTMLDECKGEKFEEALVAFSTLVLHKVVAARRERDTPIARKLALAPKVQPEEQKSLLPLAIAHRASLTAILRRKEQLRPRYLDFQHLLDEKSEELRREEEVLKREESANTHPEVSQRSIQKIRQRFESHWQGNPRWLDVLLNGDPEIENDALLDAPFEETWKSVVNGELQTAQTSKRHGGLLQNLESRVSAQQKRLEQWKQYRDKLVEDTKPTSSEGQVEDDSKAEENLALTFDAHKTINLSQWKASKSSPQSTPANNGATTLPDNDDYTQLLQSMQQELDDIDAPNRRRLGNRAWDAGSVEHARPKFSMLGTPLPGARRPYSDRTKYNQPMYDKSGLLKPQSKSRSKENQPISSKPAQDSTPTVATPTSTANPPNTAKLTTIPETHPLTPPTQPTNPTPDTATSTAENDDEEAQLAAQIIAATINASPSPTKAKAPPSLAERTRLSMALASPQHAPQVPPAPAPHAKAPANDTNTKTNANLLSRTRRSLSLLPAQPRKSKNPSRKLPTNQFETPKKQATIQEEMRTPPEKLFSDDVDYASVFKSRPKIAMSPIAGEEEEEEEGEGVMGRG